MIDKKALFTNKELRLGGFYELCIQVCPSKDMKPIEKYTNYVWKLDNVEGPFDIDFNESTLDFENIEHRGILNLGDKYIPFKTFNIRETEPIETGFNWFDICFYTAAIENIFGQEYQTWTENPKSPELLDKFLHQIMSNLYKIYPFKLAMIDFEISGQYYLDDLKDEFENWTSSIFFVGRENYKFIAEENKRLVTVID